MNTLNFGKEKINVCMYKTNILISIYISAITIIVRAISRHQVLYKSENAQFYTNFLPEDAKDRRVWKPAITITGPAPILDYPFRKKKTFISLLPTSMNHNQNNVIKRIESF